MYLLKDNKLHRILCSSRLDETEFTWQQPYKLLYYPELLSPVLFEDYAIALDYIKHKENGNIHIKIIKFISKPKIITNNLTNDRFYDKDMSKYLTMKELKKLIDDHVDFKVITKPIGEDITEEAINRVLRSKNV